MQGKTPNEDGISRQEYVFFHPSGEPMIPEWNSETPVKIKRNILLHFLRVSYGRLLLYMSEMPRPRFTHETFILVMATGIPSAHPPYKKIMEGDISDYISVDYRPDTVHDEPFTFRKPGEIKVAHLDAWLSLIQHRQNQYLRREADDIFRFSFVRAGSIPKAAIYEPRFMKSYALEHGPIYKPTLPSQINLTTGAVGSSSAQDGVDLEDSRRDEAGHNEQSPNDQTDSPSVNNQVEELQRHKRGVNGHIEQAGVADRGDDAERSVDQECLDPHGGTLDDADAQLVDQYLVLDDNAEPDAGEEHEKQVNTTSVTDIHDQQVESLETPQVWIFSMSPSRYL